MSWFNNTKQEQKYYVLVESDTYNGEGDFEWHDLTLEEAKNKLKECKDKIMIGLLEDLEDGMKIYNWKNVVQVNIYEE